MTSKNKPRRVVTTGNRTEIVSAPNLAQVTKIQREYRFAFNLKNIASFFANQASKTTDADFWERQSYVTGAICMSYAYLEAALNEFIHLNALDEKSPLTEAEREVLFVMGAEGLSSTKASNTLERFNLMLRILGKKEIPKEENLYLSANLVRLLRNMLTHPVPGVVTTYDIDDRVDLSSQQKIVKQLRPALQLDKNATFPDSIIVPKCAAWAVKSCEEFFAEFVVLSGVSPGFVTTNSGHR